MTTNQKIDLARAVGPIVIYVLVNFAMVGLALNGDKVKDPRQSQAELYGKLLIRGE